MLLVPEMMVLLPSALPSLACSQCYACVYSNSLISCLGLSYSLGQWHAIVVCTAIVYRALWATSSPCPALTFMRQHES